MNFWPAPVARGPLDATVEVPGSKSITNRALVLAALANGPSTLTGVLRSRDTDLMVDGLRALGVTIDIDGDTAHVAPTPLVGGKVDCGLAGTVMRFMPPVATLAKGEVAFDGDEQARTRPLQTVLDALRALGATIGGNQLPFSVFGEGALPGGTVTIDASGSSQFVSGLLLSGARFDAGVRIIHDGKPVPSMPHIDMTIDMLRQADVVVEAPGDNSWFVKPGPIHAVDWTVEPDLSNATAFLAAAAVAGGTVRVPNWPHHTTQPGDAFREILATMGANVSLAAGTLTVTSSDSLSGIDIDLHDLGELTPTIAAMAAFAQSPSHLRGIAHLRGHETDRLSALATELNKVGAHVTETDDGLDIVPGELHGAQWMSYADHRMATAGAIVGLKVPGIEVDNIETTAKTLPGFANLWTAMLGDTL